MRLFRAMMMLEAALMGSSGQATARFPTASSFPLANILNRIASRRAATLLGRNTVVSVLAFLFGLGLMWAFVELARTNMVYAAGASFLAATSLHYVFGRSWIFRDTERRIAAGYGYFLVNAGIGVALTVALFAALISWTPVNYLVARLIVSVFAGLVMFLLNAVFNFKQL
jgi:putative flippase GtrA